jgi:hypothetical protein
MAFRRAPNGYRPHNVRQYAFTELVQERRYQFFNDCCGTLFNGPFVFRIDHRSIAVGNHDIYATHKVRFTRGLFVSRKFKREKYKLEKVQNYAITQTKTSLEKFLAVLLLVTLFPIDSSSNTKLPSFATSCAFFLVYFTFTPQSIPILR